MATTMALVNSGGFCTKFLFATRLSSNVSSLLKTSSARKVQQLQSHNSQALQPVCNVWIRSFFGNWSSKDDTEQPTSNKKPKSPANVFVMYIKRIQNQIQKEHPDASRREIVAIASQKWKDLDPEEKSRMAVQRKELYEKYKEDLKIYIDNMTPEEMRSEEEEKKQKTNKKLKMARRELGMPKLPGSAFGAYMTEQYPQYAGETNPQTTFKKLREAWDNLDENGKKKYKEIACKKSEAYKEEMERWEKEMMEMGRFDVIRRSTLLRLASANNPKKRSKKETEEL